MKKRLAIWLAMTFAAFHLIVVGGAVLESPQGGEGFAFVIGVYDGPLLVLCLHVPVIGKHICHGLSSDHYSVVMISGTVVYALGGFAIGVAIVRIRELIARRWD